MWFQWFSFAGLMAFTFEFFVQFLLKLGGEDKLCLDNVNYGPNITCDYMCVVFFRRSQRLVDTRARLAKLMAAFPLLAAVALRSADLRSGILAISPRMAPAERQCSKLLRRRRCGEQVMFLLRRGLGPGPH
jgi:hypothetical protein